MTALVSKSTGKVFCGASLINSQFVLTAGHCMMNQNPGSFSVVVGETEAASFPSSSKIFLPLRIVNHPLFSGSPDYNNDLSLIQLNREINLVNSSDTTTVCLPRTTMTTFSSPFTVIGWGYIRNGGPQATKLLEASVRQQNQNYCQRTYGATKYTSRHICASGPDRQGVCNGDSGGPLILKQGQKSFLLATVSYGVTCGDSRYPAVFTRTQPYLPWIFSVTRNMGDYCSK
jgi:trypsin